ncbi:hypothetical protein Q8A67_008124 [Cirrhinus molitorella]|uniref:Uncharacterized protein n=1 Tax=Cirrhinus molitorella TaxID=172907 RepID=A0AA88Q5J7_9TELE|nr:hypothetical protein Q8A67_008124 [Cirrhinus molitorella]
MSRCTLRRSCSHHQLRGLQSAPAIPALNPSTAQSNITSSGNNNGNPLSTEPETRTINSRIQEQQRQGLTLEERQRRGLALEERQRRGLTLEERQRRGLTLEEKELQRRRLTLEAEQLRQHDMAQREEQLRQ